MILNFDENDFFREVTLRICSSLEIEKALWKCFLYIQQGIPIKQMSLHLYDQRTGIVETVAYAAHDGGELLSFKTPLPANIRKEVEIEKRSIHIRKVRCLGKYDGTREIARKLNIIEHEGIIVDLVLERQLLGVLLVAINGDEKLTKTDLELLGLLNRPLSIAFTNYMRYREVLTLKDMLADESRYFQDELRRVSGEEIVGADSGLRKVMEMVRQVSLLDSPVLLMGETGVGKEIIANAIHNISHRRNEPFIKVNCGAIPESLMDSELFGHEKGAFTGAVSQKRGRFERAHGGTIFLDEIGELSPNAQVRLLRVLQEKEIERVGGTETIRLDIRVIAATHRDLEVMMEEGKFRTDLYFRLQVFPIMIPPLRNRKKDIPSLAHHFILKKSLELKLGDVPPLSPGAIDCLETYSWPGNVRELENSVERALILSKGQPLSFSELETVTPESVHSEPLLSGDEILDLDTVTAKHIRKVLELAGGKVYGKGGAGELLGVDPSTLRHRMRKLGIPFGRKTKKSR